MATSLGETSLAIDPLQNQNCNGSNASSSHTSSPSFQNDDNNQMFTELNEEVLLNPKCENSQDTKLNENSSNGEGVFIFNNEVNSSLLCNGISPKKEAIESNDEVNMNSIGSVENKKRKYENDNDNISNASSSTSNKRSNTSNSKSSKSASEDNEVCI